jgi:hypothetical protein
MEKRVQCNQKIWPKKKIEYRRQEAGGSRIAKAGILEEWNTP